MASTTYTTRLVQDPGMCLIPVPFDPAQVFGRVRAPVKVTLNGYSYRSTICSMKGYVGIPLRRSNREAAGLEGHETVRVRLELDTEKRAVKPPPDLVRALRATPGAWERWGEMSFTHQREYVEAIVEARKPETRARRVEGAVRVIAARPPRKPAAADRPRSGARVRRRSAR